MRFNRLDLNLLVALDALLTERSITKASERLNLSQSATSNALARLREYFDDELLVQVGRRMEPTPRAEGLRDAVRDVLVRVDATIAIQPEFDPSKSDRIFRIFVSDYTQMVFAPHLLALAHEGMTMVVVSHEMGFARAAANRAILMDGGQIIEEAPPNVLFTNPTHERTKLFLSKVLS